MQICSFLACCYSASFLHEKYGVAKTRVRITQRVRVGVGVRVRVRVRMRVRVRVRIVVGIPILDFHPKFLPPKIVFFILYISLNFTIRASWTWRGLKTIHLPVFFILYISLNFTIRASWTWRGLKTIHLPIFKGKC